MIEWFSKERNRAIVYRVLVAVVPLLLAAGWISEEVSVQVLGIATAVFGGVLASGNTSLNPPD